jgi:uncharacterized membrane protein
VYTAQYEDLLAQPWLAPVALVTPPEKLLAMLLWVAPFVFLPLFSPLVTLLVPLALVRLLGPNASYWGISFHYAAPLAPILAMSAGDGLARLARRLRSPTVRRRVVGWAAGISVLFSAILPGSQPFWDRFDAAHYRPHVGQQIWQEMAALIPPTASVVAQSSLLPHFSRREHVYLLEERTLDGGQAEFVAATSRLGEWPAPNHEVLAEWIEARRKAGYQTIFERDGCVLLQRLRD